jgi:sigma-54 dependent transcriptional regulator, acetoin dehydrogenase operon transcriptional activator AcoR
MRAAPLVAKPRAAQAQAVADPAHASLIEQSHGRCAALGLSRIEQPDPLLLASADLAVTRERNQRLYRHAAPVMDMLREQIAETASMVVLTDAIGTVLHSTGDADFLARASQVALSPGANWSEPSQGTNAIGTALMEEQATLVHAAEHYRHANHFLTCSAAPILDPRGNILGVLDVTGDHRSYHRHTMALVKLSARMIENHWLSDDNRDVLRLHFHHRAEFLGTLMEGILAVRPDGRISGANRGALEQLGIGSTALRMQTVQTLFGLSVGEIADRFAQPPAPPMRVWAACGGTNGTRAFALLARFEGARSFNRIAATPPAAIEPRPPEPLHRRTGTALAKIDTGDAAVARVIAALRRASQRAIPVMLMGEPGSGKRTLARAMHDDGPRCGAAFVEIDGSITDAATLKALSTLAGMPLGTLYIHRIGALAAPAQQCLLQLLLQAGVDDTPPLEPRFALVCADREPLAARLRCGAFDADLFHRINGLSLQLPPLRERSDLPALVQRILQAELREGATGATGPGIAAAAMARLQAAHWSGNLRQLRNVLRAAACLAGDGAPIGLAHLSDDFDPMPRPANAAAPVSADRANMHAASLHEIERDTVERVLAETGGNISATARRLGVSRNTIYRKRRG